MKHAQRFFWVVYMFAAVRLFEGCGRNENKFIPSPPPEVTVGQPVERDVTIYAEYTGNTVAFLTVDLRARVKGYLQGMSFKMSSLIKKGDLLFVIEPEPYQAQVDQAKGDLEAKQAQHKASVDELAIKQEMFSKNAASKLDVINATDKRDTTQAQITMAKASLDQAQITYGYTHIYAPLTGRINRNMVDVGNLVGAGGQETLLATIVQEDPMYAYFNISERDLLQYMAMHRAKKTLETKEKPPVYLGLATEEGYPHVGEIDYVDNRVDPDTGTIQVRGVFPNSDGALVAGLFVRIRVPTDKQHALLVPDVALGTDQRGEYLLVVDDKNMVEYRSVKVGALVDGMRVIREGLTPKERVIVNGILRARPGKEVRLQEQKPGPPAETAPSPAKPSGSPREPR